MQNGDFFQRFRKNSVLTPKVTKSPKVFFQIMEDDYGAYVKPVDDKGGALEVSYLNYSGAERNVLRSLSQIQEKNNFVIDWEKPNGHVYLNDFQYLMGQLRHCKNVVDATMKPLAFDDEMGFVKVIIQALVAPKEGQYRSQIVVQNRAGQHPDFTMLTEEAVLLTEQSLVIDIPPLGANFNQLKYFNTTVEEKKLGLFLSLLFSYHDNVKLNFLDYQLSYTADAIAAQPSLIFEKVDEDNALYMRVAQVLPEFPVDTLETFDLYRYASISEMEQHVTVKFIEQAPLQQITEHLSKLLKPKRKRGEENTIEGNLFQEGSLFILPSDLAAYFIYETLPTLLGEFQIFGAEKLRNYKVKASLPKLSLNLSHGIDFLEGEATLDFEGEVIGLFDALAQLKKQKYILLSDGSHALVNTEYIRRLERIFQKKGNKVQLSFFDLPLVDDLLEEQLKTGVFKKSRAIFEGFNDLAKKKAKLPSLNATLRPYQKQGYKWLQYLYEQQLGGCLADDMGLGKTLQTIALLATIYPEEKAPTLIVMPRSLLFNWKQEVLKFAPQMSTFTFYGHQRDWEEAQKNNLILTTYGVMRSEIEQLKDISFHYLILDESQNIKNIQAQTTKAAMLLKAKHRLALSGTPIENNLAELYSLFRFLNPAMFGSLRQFNEDYLSPIQKENDQNVTRELRKKIYPFILRRLKKDVLQDLPDKVEQIIYVEMSDEQKKLYEQRRQFYQVAIQQQIASQGLQQSRFFIFQALNELRQIASIPENLSDDKIASPKRELLEEQLNDTIANGHKALIFVNYLNAIELISQQLEEMGVDFVSMTGATRNREILVDRFQNDPQCKVFLMTLKTGGTGLNLTAADTVFIFDPWWNVAAETQAIDRAHRIGQLQKVMAYKFITQDTIEEKIILLQQRKKELFDSIISTDSGALKSMTEEDINYILG
ncbi:MAG: DEAD/DEAH box helicase [Saprospiraceae bacterium]